jgi:hypothetical protein
MSFKKAVPYLVIGELLSAYLIGYVFARAQVFHAVEHYPEGKGGPRKDYIAKKEQEPGEGWEYQFFLPAIKVEETLTNFRHNFRRF